MAKILIADDERDIRDLIALTIRADGHEVFAVSNGEEVLVRGHQVIPDLFLLDVRMPRMNGYEACRIIKETPELSNIPVVFLSAKGQENEIQQGLNAGAEAYLLKPFTAHELMRHIRRILRDARLGLFDHGSINERPVLNVEDDLAYLVQRYKQMDNEYAARIAHIKSEHRFQIERYQQEIGHYRQAIKQLQNPSANDQAIQSVSQYPLVELSRITDGIVHDIRNGIGIIRNTIGFMSEDRANTAHAKDVAKISRSLDFCEVVLRNLAALGGQEIIRPEWVNLEKIVREICFMLENKLVDIHIDIQTSNGIEPIILADQGHMKQVFMNLIKNAGEAMPNGGILTCRFQKENDMMKIDIQDSGYGISLENQNRLFNELFTTKERGYGIGLFVVRSIIKRHGGKISVKSLEHVGTTFTLLLPIRGKDNE
jgi:signal transduction histidine kinase